MPLSTGFFGALLSLLCQNFSMVDVVMLLHGHFQPLQRLQPQLRSFFHQHYLGGQEPTPGNIRVNEDLGPRALLLLTFNALFLTMSPEVMTVPAQTLDLLGVEGLSVLRVAA